MNESKPNQIKVPVAVLKAGETRSIQTVLEFPDPPVTFKLIEGSGPVYIHGQQVPGNYEIEDTTELSGEEEEVRLNRIYCTNYDGFHDAFMTCAFSHRLIEFLCLSRRMTMKM